MCANQMIEGDDWEFHSDVFSHDHNDTEQETATMESDDSPTKPGSHSRTPSTTSQPDVDDFARARGPRRPRSTVQKDENEHHSSGDEWDVVADDKEVVTEDTWENLKNPTPSYDFPGTWDTAIHQTSHAVREVTTASKSYCNALYKSGIGQAGWSIGSALAGTTSRGALTAAAWAVQSSGTSPEQLPGTVQRWLKGKEELDEARKRAVDAEKARLARKYRRQLPSYHPLAIGPNSVSHSRTTSMASSSRRPSSNRFNDTFEDRSDDRTGLDIKDLRTTQEEYPTSPKETKSALLDNDEWLADNQDPSGLLLSDDPEAISPGTSKPPPTHFDHATDYEPTPNHKAPRNSTNPYHFSELPGSSVHRPGPLRSHSKPSPYIDTRRQSSGYFGNYAVQSFETKHQFTTTPTTHANEAFDFEGQGTGPGPQDNANGIPSLRGGGEIQQQQGVMPGEGEDEGGFEEDGSDDEVFGFDGFDMNMD